MKTNLHLITSTLSETTESRTNRSVNVIFENKIFDKVIIIGLSESLEDQKYITINPITDCVRLHRDLDVEKSGFISKLFKTVQWSIEAYKEAIQHKADTINCHSLSLLPLCVLLKFKMHSRLIYDIHELETEISRISFLRKISSKIIERLLIGFCDLIIVVSEPIKIWYEQTYSIKNVHVIRNFPEIGSVITNKKSNLREFFGIDANDRIYLYHGALIEDRGIELLIDVFKSLEGTTNHVVFIGFGSLTEYVKENASILKNIHFRDAMKKDELYDFIKSADVGLNLISNTCLNHEYCLPNKLWDFLSLSIPVLVNDLLGMRMIIEEFNCGWCVKDDHNSLKSAILSFTTNEISEKAERANHSRSLWGWNLEKEKLIDIYKLNTEK